MTMKKLLQAMDSLSEKTMLTEGEQITMAPASSTTQVIKKGNDTLGTVSNPQLASQIKAAMGNGQMTINADDDLDESEDVTPTPIHDFDEWHAAVKKAYPDQKFKLKGRNEQGKSTISAEVDGLDRSFGSWDMDSESGVVLNELSSGTYKKYIDAKKSAPAPTTVKQGVKDYMNVRNARDKMQRASTKEKALAVGDTRYATEGKDEGKPGKNFAKIAAKAAKEYGSKEAGERVAGAVRAKLAKQGKLEESAGSDDTISHILSKFKHEVKRFEEGEHLDNDLYDALFDYWNDEGEIPYGIAKGRDGNPFQYVSNKLHQHLNQMELEEDMEYETVSAPFEQDIQFESWDRQLTTLLNEGLTVTTSSGTGTGMAGDGTTVSVSATDQDATDLLAILKSAGIGHLGTGQAEEPQMSAYGAPMQMVEPAEVGASTEDDYEDEVSGEGEMGGDMMSLLQMLAGVGGTGGEEASGEEIDSGEASGEEGDTFEVGTDTSDGQVEANTCASCGSEECECDQTESETEDEDKKEVDEAYANEPDTSDTDLECITNVISGGLNGKKKDQTVGNPTQVKVVENEEDALVKMLKMSGLR